MRGLLALLSFSASVLGGNPLVPNVGQADPHIHYWAETSTFYAYATHDASPDNTGFLMTNWWVWSSPDLVSWTLADVLYPNATPAPVADYGNCWATDGAHKRNAATGTMEYFFYMSIGHCQVAVMKSVTTPAGPWANVLGAPLLNSTLVPGACLRDPAVFEDDDGSHYIIAGVFDYYIAKLGDDLVSLAETMRPVKVLDPTGPYGNKTDDKPFIHKAGGKYYLSWGCFYGISDSVYGPYTYTGSAIDTVFIAPDFRMNDTNGPWYSHNDYADRHGSFWTNAAGQWFYASNDRSHSTDKHDRSVFRDTVVGYVHYFSNNSIAPVVIDGTGVGEYDAAHIEAENFMELRGAAKKQHLPERGDAFVVSVYDSAALVYPNIHAAPSSSAPTLLLRVESRGNARVVVLDTGSDRAIIGHAELPDTRGAFEDVSVQLTTTALTPLSVELAFSAINEGSANEKLASIDSFRVI